MTIYEQVKEFLQGKEGQTITASELKQGLNKKYNTKGSSVIPSDYCYNRCNNGIKFDQHLLEYLAPGRYLILGENANYSGDIIHKPQGKKEERIIGNWNNGEKSLYVRKD